MLGNLPLGVLRPQEGGPLFEAIEWNEQSLAELAEQIALVRSPIRSRASMIAELAAEEWEIPTRDVLGRVRYREACDARAAAAELLHNMFPHVRDRMIAAAFGRDRTWTVHVYNTVRDLRETSVPFREKYARVAAKVSAKFFPTESTDATPLKAP